MLGASVQFAAAGEGTLPFTYQWRYNGSDIPGAINASLQITNVKTSQAGTYQVRIKNPFGRAVLSQDAQLCVLHEDEVHILSANMLANRSVCRVLICGPVGQSFYLQASTDLKNWTVLTQFTFASNLYEYLDGDAVKYPGRSYKVTLPTLTVGKLTSLTPRQFQLEVNAQSGLRAAILMSTDLNGWLPLSTNIISNGQIMFTDPEAGKPPYRFYQPTLVP